jgi:hypothetical protein
MKRREMIRATLFAGAAAAVRPPLSAAQSTDFLAYDLWQE